MPFNSHRQDVLFKEIWHVLAGCAAHHFIVISPPSMLFIIDRAVQSASSNIFMSYEGAAISQARHPAVKEIGDVRLGNSASPQPNIILHKL